jgi:hypothetical protein
LNAGDEAAVGSIEISLDLCADGIDRPLAADARD